MNHISTINITEAHQKELYDAQQLLENPSIAAKITNLIGKPFEFGLEMLPSDWTSKITDITQMALLKATDTAIYTMKDVPEEAPSNWWHKIGVAVSGGVGGFFGLPALALELPISTTIMLRSIADIARAQGESINDINTKLACLEVFALGGESKTDDATESGYYVVRTALARSVSEAAEYITAKTIAEESAPILARLIANIAERFSIQITEKMAAQAVPAIGAAGGAIINTIFIDHFQDMAKGHFVVRKLERLYGKDEIKRLYDEMRS